MNYIFNIITFTNMLIACAAHTFNNMHLYNSQQTIGLCMGCLGGKDVAWFSDTFVWLCLNGAGAKKNATSVLSFCHIMLVIFAIYFLYMYTSLLELCRSLVETWRIREEWRRVTHAFAYDSLCLRSQHSAVVSETGFLINGSTINAIHFICGTQTL